MAALRGMGVSPATIERLHLGLKAPYRSRADGLEIRDALAFPVLAEGLRASGRYAYLNLPGVTSNAPCLTTWGPGAPLVYRLGSFSADATAVVFGDVVDCWLAWQSIGEAHELAFMTRSHAAGWPSEWKDPGLWSRFSRVVVMQTPGAAEFLADIAPRCGRQFECAQLPAPFDGMSAYCADRQRPSFDDVLDAAQPWVPPMPRSAAEIPEGALGRFEAAPVRIAGAFAGGYSQFVLSVMPMVNSIAVRPFLKEIVKPFVKPIDRQATLACERSTSERGMPTVEEPGVPVFPEAIIFHHPFNETDPR